MRRPSVRELATILVALACAALIGLVQPKLAASVKDAKRDEILALPPPEQLRALVFGYRTAAADLLWAKLVVEHGIHWQDKRPFPDLPRYIDAIIALQPDHPMIYEFVDTLMLFKPEGATVEDARLVRAYLERGTRERPYDPETWLRYGQYLAYLSPSFLKDQAEIDAWKRDGALAVLHAVELGADADRSLAALSILRKLGERTAAIRHIQRAYALADDEETRRQLRIKIQQLEATYDAEEAVSRVEHTWRTQYPFVSRGIALLIGPHRPPAECAGPQSYREPRCPHDWSAVTGEGR
jgi:tetratricopeptide (TPR) repeat protein